MSTNSPFLPVKCVDNPLAPAGIRVVALMNPRPDFLTVSHTSLAGSPTEDLRVAMGATTGMICWAMAAGFGLEASHG